MMMKRCYCFHTILESNITLISARLQRKKSSSAMQSSRLKQLQATFVQLKRAPQESLPTGCQSIDLLDDDDITQWFVQLHYEKGSESTTVSIKLHFQLDASSCRMPLVYVIQPRLMASFIHHGAVCSLELMSQDWSLAADSVQLLLGCLHDTLDVYRSDNKITIDSVRPNYSSGEHENGMMHIRSAHARLFRTKATHEGDHAAVLESPSTRAPTEPPSISKSPRTATTSTSLSGGTTTTTTTAAPHGTRTVCVSTESELLAAIEHHRQPLSVNAVAESAVPQHVVVLLRCSITVALADALNFQCGTVTFGDAAKGITPASQKLRIDESEASTQMAEQGLRATLRLECSEVTVGPHATVVCDGIHVVVGPQATLRVLGATAFVFARFSGTIAAEERGSVKCDRSCIAVCCATALQEGLAVLDNATMQLTNCLVERTDDDSPLIRSMVLVSNQGVLRILEGSRLVPLCADKTILVEQSAAILIADSTVVAGNFSAVGVQGCSGSFVNTTFEGACCGVSLQVDDSNRPTGLNAELGAKVDVVDCTARNLYFGFSTIASSVATFAACCAINVVNGFTVDASTASLDHCAADANHVGLFVLHRAKCTVTSSRWGDAMTMDWLESLVREKLAERDGVEDSNPPDDDEEGCKDAMRRRCGRIVAEHRQFPCSVFSGGLFGIEVRQASVSVACVALLHVHDTALYVYDDGDATVKGLLAMAAADSDVSSQGCGVKLFGASATLRGCFTSGFPFGFAAILCTSTAVVMEECFALGGTNGFTVDGTKHAVLRRCGAETNHVALFALNSTRVLYDNNTPLATNNNGRASWWSTEGPRPCFVGATCYGVEVRESTVHCIGITVGQAGESAFNCYNNATMVAERCNVLISEAEEDCAASGGAMGEGAPSGFKVWSASTLDAIECSVSGVVFGFAAIGDHTVLKATRCRAENITNGFTIDEAEATLLGCTAVSRHVCVFTLNGGRCIMDGGSFVSAVIGVESKGCSIVLRRCSISGFSRSGLLGYLKAIIDAEDVSVEGVAVVEDHPSTSLAGSCVEVAASTVSLTRVSLRRAEHGIVADACPSIDMRNLSLEDCAAGLALKDVPSANISIAAMHVEGTALALTRSKTALSSCNGSSDPRAVVGCASLVAMVGGSLSLTSILVAVHRRQPQSVGDAAEKEGVISVESAEQFSVTAVALIVTDDCAQCDSDVMQLSGIQTVQIDQLQWASAVCQIARCRGVTVNDAALRGLAITDARHVGLTSVQLYTAPQHALAVQASLAVSNCPSVNIVGGEITTCRVLNSTVTALKCTYGKLRAAPPLARTTAASAEVVMKISGGSQATLIDSVFWLGEQCLVVVEDRSECNMKGCTTLMSGNSAGDCTPTCLVEGQSLMRVEAIESGPLPFTVWARNHSVIASSAQVNARLDLDGTSSARKLGEAGKRSVLLKAYAVAGVAVLCVGYLLRHL